MMRDSLCIILLVAMSTSTARRVIPQEETGVDCEGYRSLLSRVLVKFGVSYFADNPRMENAQWDPSQVDPLTPAELFREFYGGSATPQHFKEAILQIYYSDPGLEGPSTEDADRIVLRDNIYTFARASSYELARSKFGLLLYLGISDYAIDAFEWDSRRCLRGEFAIDAEFVITAELERLRNEIGEFRFSSFMNLGFGTTLAFAIDDTGSMGGEIEAAKNRAFQIIDERQGSLDQPQNFVLVPFNDPSVGPVTTTNNPTIFKQAISRLRAHGGGDAPELAMRGILLAVEHSQPGSTIFVITDIDAKDVELQDVLVAQAQQKNIKVVFLLTNRLSGSSLCSGFVRDDALSRRRCSTSSFRLGRDLYDYIAESTGGNVLVVSKSDIFQATQVIDSTVKQGVADMHSQLYQAGNHVTRIPVDSSILEVFLQLTGECGEVSVFINDEELTVTNSLIVGDLFEGRVPVNSRFGEWTVRLQPPGNCQFKAIGRSTKGFVSSFGREVTSPGGERILEVFQGQPLTSDDITIVIDSYGMTDGDRVDRIDLVNPDTGEVLHSNHFQDSLKRDFRISAFPHPVTSFQVEAVGRDSKGFAFKRVASSPLRFVNVIIDCDNINDVVFRPGSTVNLTLSITNHGGDRASFEVGATDTQRYVSRGVHPSTMALEGGGRGGGTFEVSIDDKATIGTTSVITITARSSGLDYLLYKTCQVVVGQRLRPTVESVGVDASISSRFAQTVMTSVVFNDASVSREAEFQIVLPIDAFITAFSMTIDGVTYDGTIEERERAERIFTAARERDLTVGHVASRDSSTTVFRTSVNLAARKRVTFQLTYQEVIKRENGVYTYGVSILTFQPVQQFTIDISICESDEIFNVDAVGFDTEQSSVASPIALSGIQVTRSSNTARVTYRPTVLQQTRFSPLGLNGRFIVSYELAPRQEAGELLVSGRNFVYFGSPNVEPMPKRVIFALDVSGSMFGNKYDQLKLAMSDILDDLRPTDEFSIVVFNSSLVRWNPGGVPGILAPASPQFIDQAKSFLDGISTQGGTDILQAVQASIDLLSDAVGEAGSSEKPVGGVDDITPIADYVIVLTDGRSTDGVTSSPAIITGTTEYNSERFGIHTIGFGSLVDAEMLKTVAAQNDGNFIQLFIDVDTHIQMVNFFEAISRPLLHDVDVEYPDDKVTRVSERSFPGVYQGQELTVTGRLVSDDVGKSEIQVSLRGSSRKDMSIQTEELQPKDLDELCQAEAFQATNFVERFEIFLRLRNLLREISATTNASVSAELRATALNQSLEHGIVTPGITSLVVLRPEDRAEVEKVLEDGEETASTRRPPTTPRTGGAESALGRGTTSTRRPFTTPPASVGGFGGREVAFGDPHFIIDLEEQITMCFDWQGKENQVYQLLHDDVVGITINTRLISKKENITLFGEIACIFSRKQMTALVSTSSMTLTYGNKKPIKMSLLHSSMLRKRGVHFRVQFASKRMSVITITHELVTFKILVQRNSMYKKRGTDHLDFSIANSEGLSEQATGLLGQFPDYKKNLLPVSIDFIPNSNSSVLTYGNREVLSTQKSIKQYFAGRTIDCWYVTDTSRLTGNKPTDFLMSDIMDDKLPTVLQ